MLESVGPVGYVIRKLNEMRENIASSQSHFEAIEIIEALILALVALRQPLNPTLVPIAVASILATLFFWLAVNRRFRFPLYLVPLYPVTIGIALYIGLRSVLMLSTGRATCATFSASRTRPWPRSTRCTPRIPTPAMRRRRHTRCSHFHWSI